MPQNRTVSKKRWIITTSGDRANTEVAKDLSKAGASVEDVHEHIPVITVSSSDDAAAKLRGIPGVIDVSPDAAVNIGPPGSRDTW